MSSAGDVYLTSDGSHLSVPQTVKNPSFSFVLLPANKKFSCVIRADGVLDVRFVNARVDALAHLNRLSYNRPSIIDIERRLNSKDTTFDL
jgi:hypothetical protein